MAIQSHSRSTTKASVCPLWFSVALLIVLTATGCERGDKVGFGAEIDEPNYRLGQQLERTGRQQEALVAYMKVIEKRGEDAPESHLQAGLLDLEYVKDPIAAIYHFKKYLELRPNIPQQSDLVRQRIETARREFAKTLPAQPLENQMERLDMVDLVGKLTRENDDLKAQLAAAKNGAPPPVTATFSPAMKVNSPTGSVSIGASNAVPTVRAPTPPQSTPKPIISLPSAPSRTSVAPSSRPQKSSRHYTVKGGDSLSKISLQVYGDRTHVKEIYAANQDVMKSLNDIKPGMELKIP